jgi:hypothetical protein
MINHPTPDDVPRKGHKRMNPPEAKAAIVEVDNNLSLLRESWLDAVIEKKSRWMGLINQALDERLVLMRMRDAKPS